MKKLLLLTFLFTSFLCQAQDKIAVIDWQKTLNTYPLYDHIVISTNDGGYLIGCSKSGGIDSIKSENSRGSYDYWIMKLDSNRNKQWDKTIGGSNADYLISVKQTFDGGYILGGWTNSDASGDKTENSRGVGGSDDYWVVKVNNVGQIQWQRTIGGNSFDRLSSVDQTRDSGFIIGGKSESGISFEKTENLIGGNAVDMWILKLNVNGGIMWQRTIGTTTSDWVEKVIQTNDDGYLICGAYQGIRGNLIKLDNEGRTTWIKNIGSSCNGYGYVQFNDIKQTTDGGYIAGGITCLNYGYSSTFDYYIAKIDSLGEFQWCKIYGGDDKDDLNSIIQTKDGGYIFGGSSSSGLSRDKTEGLIGSYNDYWVIKTDTIGKIEWQKTVGNINKSSVINNIINKKDDEFILCGTLGILTWLVNIKAIEKGIKIKGKVFQPQNSNCTQESNEKGISKVILKTEPKSFYGICDTSGKYIILTDTGAYRVKQITPSILKPFLDGGIVCPAIGYHTVSFSQYGKDTSEINFANFEKQCAYLQVELAQGRMRRCFENTTTIKYCNIGNVDTTNVQVVVTLPEYVMFVSASNTNYTISGKKVTFNIGNLRANECGTINLITKVDCVNGITGLTQCISAYILPRNKCVDQIQPDYALWDKSEVSVDGRCTGNTARFVIKNTGQNNMTDSSSYRIYKDAVQAVNKKFKLNAGDSLVINVTATGNTYRLEADQVLHFPSASLPSVTIENCGTGVASRGFVSQLPQNTVAPDVEKICLPIRDSYDPNDKSVSPSGVGTNKLVKHKVPLDYLIRFQNTGTDTAYTVVIIDTLDQNLDLSTLEFGASSHNYKIEFTGSGKPILKFTFDKINLVDSFTNEPKSHGFVSFKITPYDSIPNGTLVKNSADIYFDFNLPIKTNTTQVSIDDRLPTGATLSFVTAVKEQKNNYEAIYVYPNPFNTITNFEFVYNTKATQLIVYNINGELVANENVANQSTYQFHRNNIANGMYFYIIQNNEGEIIGRGKLVLQ